MIESESAVMDKKKKKKKKKKKEREKALRLGTYIRVLPNIHLSFFYAVACTVE